MQHTLKVVAGGFALLVVCLIVGHLTGARHAMANAALVFIALWFVAAAVNMWLGVSKAGYSVKEEAPIFLIVFAIPALAALAVWWRHR